MRQGRENIIDLHRLEFGFRKGRSRGHSLAGPVSTTAFGGELIAVMGRNGSGKSTLLRTISGLMKPLQGEIQIFNSPLAEYSRKQLARIMGFVSTEVVRVPGLRVSDLVALGRYPHTNWFGKLSSSDHEVVERALDLTSLQALRDRDLEELSDGERQRAMIARTLAQDTRILILDEPTAFLDLSHRYAIIDLLRNLALEHGKTILYSTHDLQIALQQSDKIWLIHEQTILEGAPEDMVLSGQLRDALRQTDSGTEIEMDLQTGEFAVKRMLHHNISLSSRSDELRMWTNKALERNGFKVVENKEASIHVLVETRDGHPKWTIEKNDKRIELNSIYDLSLYLRTIV